MPHHWLSQAHRAMARGDMGERAAGQAPTDNVIASRRVLKGAHARGVRTILPKECTILPTLIELKRLVPAYPGANRAVCACTFSTYESEDVGFQDVGIDLGEAVVATLVRGSHDIQVSQLPPRI